MDDLYRNNSTVLRGTTEQGNTCLHIASLRGHKIFCTRAVSLLPDLLSVTNKDDETPLLVALKSCHVSLALDLLQEHINRNQKDALLKLDKQGFNVLHHAIRSDYRKHKDGCNDYTELALKLIDEAPDLSRPVKNDEVESPMFMAVLRGFNDVYMKLLNILPAEETDESVCRGAYGYNALHAAVKYSQADFVEELVTKQPGLAKKLATAKDDASDSAMQLTAHFNRDKILEILLRFDLSLGYQSGTPLLLAAATHGHVEFARKLLQYCPDAPYRDIRTGRTCLHEAVARNRKKFVEFILQEAKLWNLVNMQDKEGHTALHLAVEMYNSKITVEKCDSKMMVSVLLGHPHIDITVHNNLRPIWQLFAFTDNDVTEVETTNLVMDKKLLDAAVKDDIEIMEGLDRNNATMLSARTAQGNTCLHIASLHGNQKFCSKAVSLRPDLLSVTNKNGETPLLVAVKSCHGSLALDLLQHHIVENQKEALLNPDKDGFNVLHHAIRNDYRKHKHVLDRAICSDYWMNKHGCNDYKKLALKLIDESSPDLSRAVNKYGESPIYMAVLRGFKDVYKKLLGKLPPEETDESVCSGTAGYNALHAAVKYDERDFVDQLVKKQPRLAKKLAIKKDDAWDSAMQLTAHFNRVEILRILLELDLSLGYYISESGTPLLLTAAFRGHVGFARQLLQYCPDAPYRDIKTGRTCLHEAVDHSQDKFVEFILEKDSKLRNLCNMQDHEVNTALHRAVEKCDSKMVRILLGHPHIDITVHNYWRHAAIWKLFKYNENEVTEVKTTNWSEISNLIFDADHRAEFDINNLYVQIENKVIAQSKKDVKSLTETYTGNTSVVTILMASVTFAAAFALPGGYSSVAGSEGLAIMAKKPSFQAFLVFDTVGMCLSLAVSFLCIKIRSMDYEFFLKHRSFTQKLLQFAYISTALAFVTGLYTVVGPPVHWLAITVCVLSVILAVGAVLFGEWPILKLKIESRIKCRSSNFLDMA